MDKKTVSELSKLKTEYRKRFKEKGETIQFSLDNETISINAKDKYYLKTPYHVSMKEKLGILEIRNIREGHGYHWSGFPKKEIAELLFDYIEKYANIKGIGAIYIRRFTNHPIEKSFGYSLMEDKFDDKTIKRLINYVYPELLENHWIKELKPGFSEKILRFCEKYNEVLEELKEDEPTMVYILEKQTAIKEDVKFYYEGYEGEIKNIFDGNSFILTEKTLGEFKVKDEVELEELLKDKIFKKINQKQRIRNLSEPPKMHFISFANRYLLNGTKHYIHNIILKERTPKEAEELFSKVKDSVNVFQYDTNHYSVIKMLELDDYIFVFDERQAFHFSIDEFEKAEEKMNELILNNVKRETSEKKKRFKEKMQQHV